ncbi:hypothetical protein [Brevundimonas sp.]|uniref:hypothetical protein n=1 Tax=Brevundimonas sp. TaxID=1871086 RepID=UPI0028ABCC45|nr:hypothetical protein [Brevundimonas sp.]
MRLQFSDLSRPKQAAKNLARLPGAPTLSSIQAAIARSLGYRDWHDFSTHPSPGAAVDPASPLALDIIAGLADLTGLPDADIQYAVSKARLFGSTPWTLDAQLGLRAQLWRRRLFGPPGRGKPGTVVRDMAYNARTPAYLLAPGRPTTILQNEGRSTRADFEVTTPRTPLPDFIPSRLWLPYGFWTLKDGSEVLFSRDYYPLWRVGGGSVERLDPWLWIEGKADETHFTPPRSSVWSSGPAKDAALARLATHRIADVPRLADIIAHLIEPDVETFGPAVARLRKRSYPGAAAPAFARMNDRLRYD